jgi:hypothetical protein
LNKKLTETQKQQISAHDFFIDGPLTHPFESLQTGNGDIGASVNIYSHEVKITLAKSDVWDARFGGDPEGTVFKQDDVVAQLSERDLLPFRDYPPHSDYYDYEFRANKNHGPFPKRVGAVRVYHPGLSNTKVNTHLSILTGTLDVRFGFPKGELLITAFVQRGKNKLWLSVEGKGEIPWVSIIMEKEPDDADRSLPFPEI